MPPLDWGEHLLGYFFEAGPAMPTGAGLAPLSHTELRCWQDNTGVELAPWEVRLLRQLSREFIAERARAEKRDAKAPWNAEMTPAQKRAVALSMRDSIRAMAK